MLSSMAYRGRFAPSPTGPLHFGSLLAALGSWLLARQAGGRWLVRMEDLDPPREVAGAAESQLQTLAAFGLESDEPVVRQSTRSALYQDALADLLARGHAFQCHCSRADLIGEAGIHRNCRDGAQRPDPAIRLRVADGVDIAFQDAFQGPQRQDVGRGAGDFVLRRTDGLWAYQLAVVADDAAQGITDVVRGADLLDSTPRQVLLQRLLGLPTPRYAHLPLVLDDNGRKLSKSTNGLPVDAADPVPALKAAWRALAQPPGVIASQHTVAGLLESAVQAFDPQRLQSLSHVPLAALHNGSVASAD